MKNPVSKFGVLALAASLLFGGEVMAQSMSSTDYQAAKAKIKSEYKVEKKSCASLAGNAKEICKEVADGKENVALAELENSYKPTQKTQYKVLIAKSEANYEVAKQQCHDQAGNPKDVCIKEAKAAKTAAKADASVQLKTAAINAGAHEKSSDVQNKASSQKAEVRSDATAEKREAQYKVEKEKCDAFAASAKDNCLTQAKVNFGKP